MPAPSDLVHETSTTTGTGNFTLTNANGKRSFNTAFGSGAPLDVFDYYISNRDAAEWERGTGHLSAASTLVRDTVLASSNAGAAVNFSAGTKDVTNDVPAAKQLSTEHIATQANQETGTSTTTLVTPGRQQYHPSAVKAWVNFNGTGTVAIRSDYGVSTIDDDGVGLYGVNFDVAFSNGNYAYMCDGRIDVSTVGQAQAPRVTPAVGSLDIATFNSAFSNTDAEFINVFVCGDQ